MKIVAQLVKDASVEVENRIISTIDKGLLIYLGISTLDTVSDIDYIVKKVSEMRICPDENNKTNLSVKDEINEILVISQFTLLADLKKGRRPSYDFAAKPDTANEYYLEVCRKLTQLGFIVNKGQFRAEMNVKYTNCGPTTYLLDSK